MIAVNQDAFTRIDILQRLVLALEVYSRFWTYQIRVTEELSKVRRCGRVYGRRSEALNVFEFQSRLEELYIEMLANGYRYAKRSRSGSIYFEHYDGHVIRVSDHDETDDLWTGNDRCRSTVRIDSENWFLEVDNSIERLGA